MKRSDRFQFQERIISLARVKGTGSLTELSKILGLSTRTTKRLIMDIRTQGIPIHFDRSRRSYVI